MEERQIQTDAKTAVERLEELLRDPSLEIRSTKISSVYHENDCLAVGFKFNGTRVQKLKRYSDGVEIVTMNTEGALGFDVALCIMTPNYLERYYFEPSPKR